MVAVMLCAPPPSDPTTRTPPPSLQTPSHILSVDSTPKQRSALQMSSLWFHYISVPSRSSTDTANVQCVYGTHTHTHWDVCCQHDPVPQPPFSIFQLFCHFSSSNLSGDLLSPLCLPQERGPASETSTQITDVG